MTSPHKLLRYDIPRQTSAVFLTVAAFTTTMILFGFVINLHGTPPGEIPQDPQTREEAFARVYAAEQAHADARAQALNDLLTLAADAAFADGRQLAYELAWNTAVAEALSHVPGQWRAERPHTQWIELRR